MIIKDLEKKIEDNIKKCQIPEMELTKETTKFKKYGCREEDTELIRYPTLGQEIFCVTRVEDEKKELYYENPYKKFTVGIVAATALTLGINPEIPPYLATGIIGLTGIVGIVPATLTKIVDRLYENNRQREFKKVRDKYNDEIEELRLERKELRYQLYREENPNDDLVMVGDILKIPVEKTCCKRGHARGLFNAAYKRIIEEDINPIKRDQMIIQLYDRFYQPMHDPCQGDNGYTSSNMTIVGKVIDAYAGLQYHGLAPEVRGIVEKEIPNTHSQRYRMLFKTKLTDE